eukprot:gene43147-57404_t
MMRTVFTVATFVSATNAFTSTITRRMPVRSLAMIAKEGDSVPNDVTSADLFKGKRAVVFSLPGAFTPTCSSTHLPGYEKNYEAIKALGIDDVYCLSVNDAFVMRQWGIHQGLPKEDKDKT